MNNALRTLAATLLAATLCAFARAPLALAQGDAPPPTRFNPSATLRIGHLTADQGLPSNRVEAVLQDARGFLWFGTSEGLARYDGYRFLTYRHDEANPRSLSSNDVTALLEGRDGALWVGTRDGGLNRLDPLGQTFARYLPNRADPRSIGSPIVTALDSDKAGNLWLTTAEPAQLARFDPASQTFQRYPLACGGQSVGRPRRVLADDDAGAVWVLVDDLLRFDLRTQQLTCYRPRPGPGLLDPRTVVRLADVVRDPAGALWLAGSDALYRFDPQSAAFTAYRPAPRADDVAAPFRLNTLRRSADGLLWLGSATEEGVTVFDPQRQSFVAHYGHDPTTTESASAAQTLMISEDREGLLWVATASAGVDIIDRRQLQFAYYRGSPLDGNAFSKAGIQAMYEDDAGTLWIGSSTVLTRFNRADGSFKHFPVFTGPLPLAQPEARLIASIYPDEQGGLWFDGIDGLYRFDPKSEELRAFRDVPIEPGRPLNVWQIAPDARGNFWVLAGNTLSYFDRARERFTARFPLQPKVPEGQMLPPAFTLTVDRAGDVWVGGAGYLARLDQRAGRFDWYQHDQRDPASLPDGEVRAILAGASGDLWLATNHGLARLDRSARAFERYTERDGLPTNELVSLAEDRQGHLWVSSTKGLARLDPARREFERFDRTDGLQGNQFNLFAAYQSRRGELFFGGSGGLSAFFPERLSTNQYQPPLALTGMALFNRPVPVGDASPLRAPIWATDSLTLAADQRVFSLEFAALSYSAPQHNRYRYRLEGFEEQWNEVESERRFVTYTSLPPGTYSFRVQGSNNSGLWSDQEINLRLTILPPWWATWWFRLAALAGLAALAAGGTHWRERSMSRRNRLLAELVDARTAELAVAKDQAEAASQAKSEFLANMSHELRTPLNGILGYAQILQRYPDLDAVQREGLRTIHESGKHLLTLISDVLDLARIERRRLELYPQPLHLPTFLESIVGLMRLAAQQKGIALVYEQAADLPEVVRADGQRLRQVLLNLLGNAVKFTGRGAVTFRVSVVAGTQGAGDAGALRFAVRDTGVGIAPTQIATIFRPFEQAGDARQRAGGAGLGLAISQELVRLMGSEIQVQSAPGQGSLFWFDVALPALGPDALARQSAPGQIVGYRGARRRLLVADDRSENRAVLRAMLEPLGFVVTCAVDGHEAVAQARQQRPDLILIDLVMPVMSGFDAVLAIRQSPALASVPIIAVSASVLEMNQAQSRLSGCDDFLPKPVDIDQVFAMLGKYLGLEWLYAAGPDPDAEGGAEPDAAGVPPRDELEALYDLARLGNMDRLIQRARHIEALSPHYRAFARDVSRLAASFDDEQIQALVKQHL